jgi:flavin reductase (DIM6/NTAB) family NADH-FMN oxidoreductase RutF
MSVTEFDAISSADYRRTLGHYPTGVVLITAVVDGEPVGMLVGSFTSVSLDPPLVAFLPDKNSSTFKTLRRATSFVVNVLAANQEGICRTFASKAVVDKWDKVGWRPAASGAPILDGAVAWIDCQVDHLSDAGDHYLVMGRIRDLGTGAPGLPLLFFQGGYGRFTPLSLVLGADSDVVSHLRLADIARGSMERLADSTRLECSGQVVADSELVLVASAGTIRDTTAPTRVGIRVPFIPPYGALFVAWAKPAAVEAWLAHLSHPVTDSERKEFERTLQWIRREQSVISFGSLDRELQEAVDELFASGVEPTDPERMRRALEHVGASYSYGAIKPEQSYDVRFIGAPVFDGAGDVVMVLRLYGFTQPMRGEELLDTLGQLKSACADVTRAFGGRWPVASETTSA